MEEFRRMNKGLFLVFCMKICASGKGCNEDFGKGAEKLFIIASGLRTGV